MDNKNLCPSCGAPTNGYKCEYCGRQFYNFADLNPREKINIRFTMGDTVIETEAYISDASIEREVMPKPCRDIDNTIHIFNDSCMHINIEFISTSPVKYLKI